MYVSIEFLNKVNNKLPPPAYAGQSYVEVVNGKRITFAAVKIYLDGVNALRWCIKYG